MLRALWIPFLRRSKLLDTRALLLIGVVLLVVVLELVVVAILPELLHLKHMLVTISIIAMH